MQIPLGASYDKYRATFSHLTAMSRQTVDIHKFNESLKRVERRLFSPISKGDSRNAHRFYTLMVKVLKLCKDALKELNLEEFEERLKRLEAEAAEA